MFVNSLNIDLSYGVFDENTSNNCYTFVMDIGNFDVETFMYVFGQQRLPSFAS